MVEHLNNSLCFPNTSSKNKKKNRRRRVASLSHRKKKTMNENVNQKLATASKNLSADIYLTAGGISDQRYKWKRRSMIRLRWCCTVDDDVVYQDVIKRRIHQPSYSREITWISSYYEPQHGTRECEKQLSLVSHLILWFSYKKDNNNKPVPRKKPVLKFWPKRWKQTENFGSSWMLEL